MGGLVMEYTSTYEDRLPDGMLIYRSRIAGNPTAICTRCDYVCGYWEYNYELFHDCQGGAN